MQHTFLFATELYGKSNAPCAQAAQVDPSRGRPHFGPRRSPGESPSAPPRPRLLRRQSRLHVIHELSPRRMFAGWEGRRVGQYAVLELLEAGGIVEDGVAQPCPDWG